MKKIPIGLLLILFLAGCTTMILGLETSDDVRAKNASNLLKLTIGMKKRTVLWIMGTKTMQTYRPNTGIKVFKDTKISNPYRTGIMTGCCPNRFI